MNGDLYEVSNDKFGIFPFPSEFQFFKPSIQGTYHAISMMLEPLHEKLSMDPYTDIIATTFKLNLSDDWLHKQQGLALPVLPPTTPEAQQYFLERCRSMQPWPAVKESRRLIMRPSHENGIKVQMERTNSTSQLNC